MNKGHANRCGAILIVDDEPMTRNGLKRTLDAWSAGRCSVVALDDGQTALRMLDTETVDLLITDIRMPELNGLDMLDMLRSKLGTRMPSVILISGYSEFAYAQRAIHSGVLNYLLKPVSTGKLIEAVERGLQASDRRHRIEMLEKIIDPVLEDANGMQSGAGDSVREALRFVDGHLDRAFGLKEVAEHVHLNPSYFSVLFKEQMQVTFSEYLTRERLQKAREMLLLTRLPIAEIADRVGYRSAKYFNKIFKEYEGGTPGQFRADRIGETTKT